MGELKRLHIRKGVEKLFQNIGWQGLLTLNLRGFLRPTLEFASSVRVSRLSVSFRLYDQNHEMSFDDISALIHAPLRGSGAQLVGPLDRADFNMGCFWNTITDNITYESGKIKACHIVHPVLRIAHKIIACTVFARKDTGTVNTHELQLLYLMVNPSESKPCFGAFVCQRLKQYTNSTPAAITCGGIVTLLSTHPSIPSIPEDSDPIPGDYQLGLEQLIHMRIIEPTDEKRTFVWKLGPHNENYLTVSNDNKQILKLARPISGTRWRLLAHRTDHPDLPDHLMHDRGNDDEDFHDQSMSSPSHHMEGDAGTSSPQPPAGVHPWVYSHISALEQDFRQFAIDQRIVNQDQREHNEKYGSIIDSIFSWTQGHPPPPPPGLQ